MCFHFFFNDTSTTYIYTLSLHDALPISSLTHGSACQRHGSASLTHGSASLTHGSASLTHGSASLTHGSASLTHGRDRKSTRLNSSHQIISYTVFCLKKKHESYTTCRHYA